MMMSIIVAMLASGTAPTPPAITNHQIPAREEYKLPPLKYSGVSEFLDAIELVRDAETLIDTFWQPATAALVAANPNKEAVALSLADQRRAEELALYRPLVAFMLDSRAVQLLNPEVARRLDALIDRSARQLRGTGQPTEGQRKALAAERDAIAREAASRVNQDLSELARLAATPDARTVRELNRLGLYNCLPQFQIPGAIRVPSQSQYDAQCARMIENPAIKRLQSTKAGRQFVTMSAVAYVQLAAMVAMAHNPGISLHLLLPPDKVTAAGLIVPDDLSLEQMTAQFSASKVVR